jgi:predicted amidohydrolase YtcJ
VVFSLAVKDGRILAVGDEVAAHIGPNTRRIDARGATIVPGFIDSHGHMASLGQSLGTPDFRAARSVDEIAAVVRRQAAASKPGEWILGRNWDQTNWGGALPTADPLSQAAPDHPVFLSRVDGHAAWTNRRALALAGITAATPDPPGGRIIHTASGEPTGVLVDAAQDLVARKIPPGAAGEIQQQLERAARACVGVGITSVHDAGVGAEALDAYRTLIRDRKLPVRIYAMISGDGALWQEYLKRGPEIGDRLTVRSVKLIADGAMGSRGAAFLEPYLDDPGNSGLLMLTRGQIERVALQAVERGFQVNVHAIGDRANRTVLEAYGEVLKGKNDRRFRVEHAQVVAPGDFELFAKYSVIASMQATHATSDMRWVEARIGPERAEGSYAWRTLLSLGVPIANGSDFPVEPPGPLRGFYAAITRQDESGNPPGGWFPAQRMTRTEALRSWSTVGAYAAFEEKTKGSLTPGKLADFVMLSADIMQIPPAEILKTRILMTVVGGEEVYKE